MNYGPSLFILLIWAVSYAIGQQRRNTTTRFRIRSLHHQANRKRWEGPELDNANLLELNLSYFYEPLPIVEHQSPDIQAQSVEGQQELDPIVLLELADTSMPIYEMPG